MDAFGEEHKVFSRDTNTANFAIINQRDIEKVQEERTREISEQYGISWTLARAVLIKNGWVIQEAINKLLDDDDYI